MSSRGGGGGERDTYTKWLPWSDTGNDLRDGILIWFKAKYTNYIELVREGENYIWLKLKNKNKDLSSNTQNIFLWTIYIPPIKSPYFKDQTITDLEGAITHFQTQGNILIVGDLYAHTAEETHTTSTNRDKYMNNKTHTSLTLPLRNNYDKINK